MLDKQQAKEMADALIPEHREGQATASEKELARQRQAAAQRYAALFGLVGVLGGALIGHALFENWLLSAFLGLAVGTAIGSNVAGRRAQPIR